MLRCGIESRLKNKWVLCRARFVLFLLGIPYNHVPCHSDPASCAAYEESQGTWLFSEIETFLAILRSFGSRARGSDDKMKTFLVILTRHAWRAQEESEKGFEL